MGTIEDTRLGRFEIVWGTTEQAAYAALLAHHGPIVSFKKRGDFLIVRDPQYGELKKIGVYSHSESPGRLYLFGEITNGVWAYGLPADGN